VTLEPDYVEFLTDDLTPALARMAELTEREEGWINFEPAVDTDDLPPPRTGLAGLITGRGPDVPVATWTPGVRPPATEAGSGTRPRGRPHPPNIGIHHGAGPGARARLDAARHPVPEGWVVLQDHSKRGLVVAVPQAVAHADVLGWLLRAAALLSTVPLDRDWRAAVYLRSR
jgi:hypothetical protein